MTSMRFLLRTLAYHAAGHLALALGAAVACAILAGALIVGDSMEATLRSIAVERLGRFDAALIANGPFRARLAGDVAAALQAPAGGRPAHAGLSPVPVLMLDASAARVDARGARGRSAGGVRALGVDEAFFELGFPEPAAGSTRALRLPEPGAALINATLAAELGAASGDTVLLNLASRQAAPIESYLARSAGPRSLRLKVEVIPDRGAGLFAIEASQAAPRLVLARAAELGRAAGVENRSNVLLVDLPEGAAAAVDALDRALLGSLRAEDFGLRIVEVAAAGLVSVESLRLLLPADAVEAVQAAASRLNAPAQPALAHLAERIAVAGQTEKEVPYSTVAAAEFPESAPLGPLTLVGGGPAPRLAAGEALINQWAAEDLGIDPARAEGIEIAIDYYVALPDESVGTRRASFTLRGVTALAGAGSDRSLTPEFPGITDESVQRLRDWDPPFTMDLRRIRDRDEDYWKRYRAAPKAFISPEDGARLFATRFGPATSIRVAPPADWPLAELASRLERALAADGPLPRRAGFTWRRLREDALARVEGGAGGAFGQLFIGLSFYLIVSAALLAGLLFALHLDRRVREAGILLAQGHRRAAVQRYFLVEGLAVAALGALPGLGLSILYASAVLAGFRGPWADAVRTPYLVFDAGLGSLAAGYAATLLVVGASILWVCRRLAAMPARELLAGRPLSSAGARTPAGTRARRWAAAGAVLVLVSAASAAVQRAAGPLDAVLALFLVGLLALLGAAMFFAAWLAGRPRRARLGRAALLRVGARNARAAPGRSLTTVGLVAASSFLLVTVGAVAHHPAGDRPEKGSGNGGFALVAESALPIAERLDSPEGREALGLDAVEAGDGGAAARRVDWSGVRVQRLRVRPGDDASCLNLYAPRQPRLVGAPPEFIDRGGFRFASHLELRPEDGGNPWKLLTRRFDDGAVPVVGDANSTAWVLKLGLGETLEIQDGRGETLRLRLAATLAGSIFQSDLVMAEADLVKHFPELEGYRRFLIEVPEPFDAQRAALIEQALERGLEMHGLEASTPARLLAQFLSVEGAYLAIFEVLGGLGLMLGTLGLGVVLLRAVLERRAELALLQAIGFSRSALAVLVLAETAALLGLGVGIGAAGSLAGLSVRLGDPSLVWPWQGFLGWLGLMVLSGLVSASLALAAALRSPLLPALRRE
jgi:ABC-type antimicrobial peptide transport system permease subunit